MTKVLYPGSFDPITKGHMDLIKKAERTFGKVVIAIMKNPQKKACFFTFEERAEIIRKLYENDEAVEVIIGEGATVDVALQNECTTIIRGLRDTRDFDFEMTLQEINKEMSNGSVETVCFFTDKRHLFCSSSVVKEVFALGKEIDNYIEPLVKAKMLEKRGDTE